VSGVVDWSAVKKILITALIAGIIAVVTFIQNALETVGAVGCPACGAPTAVVPVAIVAASWFGAGPHRPPPDGKEDTAAGIGGPLRPSRIDTWALGALRFVM
jgi:hypothetical protein